MLDRVLRDLAAKYPNVITHLDFWKNLFVPARNTVDCICRAPANNIYISTGLIITSDYYSKEITLKVFADDKELLSRQLGLLTDDNKFLFDYLPQLTEISHPWAIGCSNLNIRVINDTKTDIHVNLYCNIFFIFIPEGIVNFDVLRKHLIRLEDIIISDPHKCPARPV